jgi:CRISPR/Cas system-associated exonuclease Cas4 (RecB family)
MRKIRASDIGSYLFCQRAWWYRQQGIESENLTDLAGGRELHHLHGRTVLASSLLRTIAYALLLAALIITAVFTTMQIL